MPPLYWGRERVERQRYDSLPDRYGRPWDFYVGFEDLALDGRGRTIVDVRTVDPRYLESRVTYPGRTCHLDSNVPSSEHRDRDLRLRSTMSERKSSVSFGKGMKRLERVLQKSGDFFGQFIREFDDDMSATAGYATVKIQEDLWRLKVIGNKDNDIAGESRNQSHREEEDEGEKPKKKFEEKKKDLTHALEVALDVQYEDNKNAGTGRSKAREESAASLQDKIGVASREINRLLDDATRDRYQCSRLVYEIQQLRNLLDPQSDTNQELFKDNVEDGLSDVAEEGRGGSGWDN